MRRLALPIFVVLAACSSSSSDDTAAPDATSGTAGQSGTGSGTAGDGSGTAGSGVSTGTSGSSGTGGTTGAGGHAGSGTAGSASPMDASVMVPLSDAAGPLSEASAPHYGDKSVVAVAATPPAQWVNVTANLAGMASECGNTPYLVSNPAHDMLITSVSQHGLWASTDGATTWTQLWATAGNAQITNRGSSIVFDPDNANTFWESGIYNGPGVYKTADNGATFAALGNAHHIDSVSVDLGDPQRMTLLAGGHEQSQMLNRSSDGGATWTNVGLNLPANTNFCTNALVIDKNIHLVGCSGYKAGAIDGVFRTADGGQTWARTSAASAAAVPLWASDGTIYWSTIYDHGIIKSTNQGNSWTQTVQFGVLKTGHLIELPDGRLVGAGPTTLMISTDKGVTFKALGTAMPFVPTSLTYSPYRNAFFIEQFSCAGANNVLANAISRFGFDYRTQ